MKFLKLKIYWIFVFLLWKLLMLFISPFINFQENWVFNSSLNILDVNSSTEDVVGKDFPLFCRLWFFSTDSFCYFTEANLLSLTLTLLSTWWVYHYSHDGMQIIKPGLERGLNFCLTYLIDHVWNSPALGLWWYEEV